MLKKLGLPVLALGALMAFAAPQKADARVRFGVSIGGPVYTAPAPVYPYGYGYPYQGYPNNYVAPAAPYAYGYGYDYPYATPYYGGGVTFGFHGDHDRDRHDRDHHERSEHFEHGRGRR
ncbi:MAG TPA: hypothetical protein VG456_09035 [Candidatus Sulfopaludibacter sp.]|jgi:hypothetical protein|nr:hypothetical protein [Candidatus Sulfopaludibacter sp.]